MNPDFILQKDGLFSKEYCTEVINFFEKAKAAGNVVTRQQTREGDRHHKDDTSLDMFEQVDAATMSLLQDFNRAFYSSVFPEYSEKFSILKECETTKIFTHKLQKTTKGQGYHVWHTENMCRRTCHRVLTYILYLNDVEDGGETEFLYYGKRIKPTAGTLLLWPAGFTHVHRGNPPLSGEKYIMTGWVEY